MGTQAYHTDTHIHKHQHYHNLALYFLYCKVDIRYTWSNDANLPMIWSVWATIILYTMLVTAYTKITNRFNRILQFADQNFVPNIANGISLMFCNNLISYLYTNSTITNILIWKLKLDPCVLYDWESHCQNVPCMLIAYKDHTNTIQVYSVTAMTHNLLNFGGRTI